nr:DinB family protein [uncultured Holophaga sp.]
MSSFQRIRLLEAYKEGYTELREALSAFPAELLDFRPAPGAWTLKEILIHLADSEVVSYVRCRAIIAEPGSVLMTHDESEWASNLGYEQQDHSLCLSIISTMRKANYGLLVLLDPSVWSENSCVHSTRGPVSLDSWLEANTLHLRQHIEQMQRNHRAWLQSAQA